MLHPPIRVRRKSATTATYTQGNIRMALKCTRDKIRMACTQSTVMYIYKSMTKPYIVTSSNTEECDITITLVCSGLSVVCPKKTL